MRSLVLEGESTSESHPVAQQFQCPCAEGMSGAPAPSVHAVRKYPWTKLHTG